MAERDGKSAPPWPDMARTGKCLSEIATRPRFAAELANTAAGDNLNPAADPAPTWPTTPKEVSVVPTTPGFLAEVPITPAGVPTVVPEAKSPENPNIPVAVPDWPSIPIAVPELAKT